MDLKKLNTSFLVEHFVKCIYSTCSSAVKLSVTFCKYCTVIILVFVHFILLLLINARSILVSINYCAKINYFIVQMTYIERRLQLQETDIAAEVYCHIIIVIINITTLLLLLLYFYYIHCVPKKVTPKFKSL